MTRAMMNLAGLILWLSCCLPHTVLMAQGPAAPAVAGTEAAGRVAAQDALFISGGAESSGGGVFGRNAALDWIRKSEQGSVFSAGVSGFWVADSRWSFGKGLLVARPRDDVLLEAQARVGGGHNAGKRFPYRTFGGGVTYQVSRRIHLRLRDEQLRIGETRGNLLKPGLVVLPTARSALDLAYVRSVSGNMDTGYFAAAADLVAGALRYFGGFAAGHTTPEVFDLGVGGGPSIQDLREGYVGLSLPVARTEWTLAAQFTSVGASRKRALTLSVRVSLGRQNGGR